MIEQYITIKDTAGASLAVTVSDTTPDVGDTITITATASGFTPTSYLFYAQQGGQLFQLAEQAGNVLNWTVNIVGTFKIFVNATDSPTGVFNAGGLDVTSTAVIITANIQLWQDPFLSNVVPPSYPDLSPFARTGTMVNSPTFVAGTLAPNGGGYTQFNGVDEYISVGTTADFSFIQNTLTFTIEAWVKVNNPSARNWFMGNTATSSHKGFVFVLETEGSLTATKQLHVRMLNGSGITASVLVVRTADNAITDTNWHHICCTMNGLGTGQWYLDGVALNTFQTGTYTLPTGNSTNVLEIGKVGGFSLYYAGLIGPLRIYSAPLSAAQVLNNFNADRARYGL